METRKLFYEDSHMRSFTARVIGCEQTDKGWAVILDATAFYPEGGGQDCDHGVLGGAQVLDVRERDGQIIHLCDKPLSVGETVEGAIDWQRRFDLMQQHSGEHVVSGVIYRRYGWQNAGFHIGAELVTIDLSGPIQPEDLAIIEKEANEAIWQNIPVRCWYPAPEELAEIPYRSKKALPWPVRIVDFPGTDTCACCGTHVKATGEIGLVKMLSCVKFRQGVRIEMVSGARALDYLSRAFEQNRQVSQTFSAKIMETGEAARRINEALAAEKYRTIGLQRQLFGITAAGYAGKGNVLHMEPGLTPGSVRELAEEIAKNCGGIAAVFSGSENAYDVCLACPGGDVKTLGTAMAKALDGRGGGKPGFFQGSVRADAEKIRAFFFQTIGNFS